MYDELEQRRTLGRLLRELPVQAHPPYDFREFERRARRGARPGYGISRGQLLAASVLITVGIVGLALRLADPRRHAPPVAESNSAAPAGTASGTDSMERLLASLPREPAVVRVGDRAAVTGLEDRIAQVDDLLSAARGEPSQSARLLALQQERTRLMGALVQVRYAQTLADASR
jgi:hypothetical protein